MEKIVKKQDYWKDIDLWSDKISSALLPYIIYGEQTDERTAFLKEIERKNPIVPGSTKHPVIYLDKFGLEEVSGQVDYENPTIKNSIPLVSTSYANGLIVKRLCERIAELDNPRLLMRAVDENWFLKDNLNGADTPKAVLQEFDDLLHQTEEYYRNLLLGKKPQEIGRETVFYTNLEFMLDNILRSLDISSHAYMILDKKGSLEKSSMQAVNEMLSSGYLTRLVLPPSDDAWMYPTEKGDIVSFQGCKFESLDNEGAKYLSKKFER